MYESEQFALKLELPEDNFSGPTLFKMYLIGLKQLKVDGSRKVQIQIRLWACIIVSEIQQTMIKLLLEDIFGDLTN